MTIYLLSLFCIHTLYLFLLSLRCILASPSPPPLSTSTISLHHSPVSMPPYILPLCIFLAFRCISVPRLYPFPTVYLYLKHSTVSLILFQYIHTQHIPVSPVPPLYLYPIFLSPLCIYILYTCPSSVSIPYIPVPPLYLPIPVPPLYLYPIYELYLQTVWVGGGK